MRIELPTQSQIIEELVDRVAAQIDSGKPVAFDNALAELVRYHRFVLGLSASTTTEGSPFNYAEVAGTTYWAPHEQWLAQYRRLFDKAAGRIPDSPHFIGALAYNLGRLLTLPEGLIASQAVSDAALNLFLALMGSVERRVTKWSDGQPEKLLPGSDAIAYAAALREMVGGWESLFHASPDMSALDRRQGQTDEQRWKAIKSAWPFLWRHLVNTAYCVGITVWNDDVLGTSTFREALVRWPENFRYLLRNPVFLAHPSLLFPDLLDLAWEEAQTKAAALSYSHSPEIEPDELFAAIIEQVHRDVLQLVAAVLAYWTVNAKRPGELAAKTARALLAAEGAERYEQTATPPTTDMLLQRFLRLQLAGERYQSGSYGAKLDEIASRLDGLSGPEMVSGRIYSTHTLHDREQTIWGDTAILAAFIDGANVAALDQWVSELVEAEALLPEGDRSLRDLEAEVVRYHQACELKAPQVLDTIAKLGSEAPEADLHRLSEILNRVRTLIAEHRARRLRERPVDQTKLEMRRAAIDKALFDPTNLTMFPHAKVVRDTEETGDLCTFSTRLMKARLTEPMMDVEISNEIEVLADSVADVSSQYANGALFALDAEQVESESDPTTAAFWDLVRDLAAKAGADTKLLLPARFHIPLARMARLPGDTPLTDRMIEREAVQRSDYLCTIDGVKVHLRSTDDQTAWLFSGEKLQAVHHGIIEPGHNVAVDYLPLDDDPGASEGELKIRFRQSYDWNEAPIFRIALSRPPGIAGTLDADATLEATPAASPPSSHHGSARIIKPRLPRRIRPVRR
ncbi:MAG: hypothetical protein JWR80_6686 [Bradyrhizobium sp.]|nr:hypothetical protein [Bradyrhizobium sp.]